MSHTLPVQRTHFTRNEDVQKNWILVDAEGETLGRLATRIAHRLRGKHRPDYSPHQDIGDMVVVINTGKIRVSGKKLYQKLYHQHSGYPGGLRSTTLADKLERDPIFAMKVAVKRMLPRGPLGRKLLPQFEIISGFRARPPSAEARGLESHLQIDQVLHESEHIYHRSTQNRHRTGQTDSRRWQNRNQRP